MFYFILDAQLFLQPQPVSHRKHSLTVSIGTAYAQQRMRSMENTRIIQKISSVCECCLCSAAVTMVLMRAEFVDTVARHGRDLQTFEQCLRIVLCVYNV
jgi:hypothetical protein